jgi:uncharacterized sporulation protein YeaH/YhbH (DUF444 family)
MSDKSDDKSSKAETSEQLPRATYIFVDRRKTGSGKSIGNRQRLLRRIKEAIRQARPTDIDAGGVGGSVNPTRANSKVNPVKIARGSLHEPTFHYEPRTGEFEIVLIGNKEYERGDELPMDDGDGTGGGAGEGSGPGEDGEDDFIVNISRDEFFNAYFEDCELPDMMETHEREIPEARPQHAGFQKEGNPAQLSVVRSYKNALPRRRALTSEAREELEKLEAEYQELVLELGSLAPIEDSTTVEPRFDEINARMNVIELRIAELRTKIRAVPFMDKIDLRYTKKEKVLVKSAEAVFVMIMDVSASMDEERKRTARKFFSLQYAFIQRKYPNTDLVFIAHTDKPYELSEVEFFTTQINGGTIVSPAFLMANDIINERYDAQLTNIYLSHASDGDNWYSDNAEIIPALEGSGLLAKLRHMCYIQVCYNPYSGYGGGGNDLWTVMQSIASTSRKISMEKVPHDDSVFDAFTRIYRKNHAR